MTHYEVVVWSEGIAVGRSHVEAPDLAQAVTAAGAVVEAVAREGVSTNACALVAPMGAGVVVARGLANDQPGALVNEPKPATPRDVMPRATLRDRTPVMVS